MNYWYVARPNELFLDIDNVSRSIKHARARLQGAIECGRLDVQFIMQRPSKSKNHLHVIITLNEPYVLPVARAVWEIILHGDIYRGCCNVIREYANVPAPDILISPFDHFGNTDYSETIKPQIRMSDDKCDCEGKHKASVMETCPAAKRLRGEFRNVGFFGKPSKNPCTIWPNL
jgi:hypothetical protein